MDEKPVYFVHISPRSVTVHTYTRESALKLAGQFAKITARIILDATFGTGRDSVNIFLKKDGSPTFAAMKENRSKKEKKNDTA